ncbi:MAG: hypothetical protein NWP98_08775 [Erythrobacter sp.]|nr:hypothetical protein [Erythrobacter sp.]
MDNRTDEGDTGGAMPTSSTAARRRRKRNFKNLSLEVAVIVTGVGIALLGEYLITEWTWSQRVERAKSELRDEAQDLADKGIERIVITPCILAQLDAIEAHLLDPAKNAEPLPKIETDFGSSVVSIPYRVFPNTAWQSSLNDGVTARLPRKERYIRSSIYTVLDKMKYDQDIGAQKLGQLSLVSVDVQRTPEANLRLLQDLQELRRIVKSSGRTWRQYLGAIDALGDLPADEELFAIFNEYSTSEVGTAGYCIDRGLPLEGSIRSRDELIGPGTALRDGFKALLKQE